MTQQRELRDSAGNSESSRSYFGWRVVAALFCVAVLAWGFGFYGHAVYLAELQRIHGWPTSLISAASTLYYFAGAILVIYVNEAIVRIGPLRCVLFGGVCFALSVAALSQVTQPWQLFAAYLVMALGWATLTLGAITNILGLWFERRRGLAISLALNGASMGGVLVIPAMVFLISAYGFTNAALGGSIVILAIILPLAIFVLGKPAPRPLAAIVAEAGAAPAVEWTRASALRSPAFWVVCAPFCLGLLSQAGFLVHQIAFLETSIGRESAGIAVAITTAMAITGRFFMGAFIERLDMRIFSAASFASQALAWIAMTQTSNLWLLLLLCAINGFSVGNLITLPSILMQREFPAAAFGMLIALSTAINQFSYSFGPALIGIVRDVFASYTPALLACAALNAIATFIILQRRPR